MTDRDQSQQDREAFEKPPTLRERELRSQTNEPARSERSSGVTS